MDLTVIIPTHNPDFGRFRATLAGLRAQTLPADHWELVIVDNASTHFPAASGYADAAPPGFRVVHESRLGLTSARRRGLREARAPFAVFVDDDNVLAPDYLAHVIVRFGSDSRLGAFGGKSLPSFEAPPPPWAREFHDLLACRDRGAAAETATGVARYPGCAPIGAGMAVRVAALAGWLADDGSNAPSDRRGSELTSSGDNDIVLSILREGWSVSYFPELVLTHLIPAGRLAPDYLARLNHGIQKSWMRVLTRHGINPWPPVAPWTLPLRKLKAALRHQPWRGPAERIRWQGACGHFEGRVVRPSSPRSA